MQLWVGQPVRRISGIRVRSVGRPRPTRRFAINRSFLSPRVRRVLKTVLHLPTIPRTNSTRSNEHGSIVSGVRYRDFFNIVARSNDRPLFVQSRLERITVTIETSAHKDGICVSPPLIKRSGYRRQSSALTVPVRWQLVARIERHET